MCVEMCEVTCLMQVYPDGTLATVLLLLQFTECLSNVAFLTFWSLLIITSNIQFSNVAFLFSGNFSLFFVVDIFQVYLSLYTTISSMADQVTSGTVVLSDSIFISSLKVSY